MKIGVDYYPEHWEENMWEQDVLLMKKTGVRVVRLAEFAWCRIEPKEGEFDFAWLDRAVALFEKNSIDVILCTPTNCPPLWLYEKYPNAVRTSPDGGHIATGIRGHRCYNDPDFVRLSHRVVDKMTKHYASVKNVAAWQIDNELESNICACEVCTKKYRKWLKNKYGSLDELNQRYGNVMWSGEFSDWEQIKPPTEQYNRAWLNPAYVLDYHRFASDDMIEYVKAQAEIIRRNCPNIPVTTNCWFCENMPDLHKAFKALDFTSYDNYPPLKIPESADEYYSHSFHLDFMRGVKQDNFVIMEQLSGAMGSWAPMSRTTKPGMIKGYSLQAFAHGANEVIHFRWRTAAKGAEMHWHGLIDHSNVPGRRFREFEDLCRTAETLTEITDTKLKSDVALIYSYDSDLALKIQPQTDGFYYYNQLKAWHDGFSHCGVNVDIISENEDFTKYRVVCAPAFYVCSEEISVRMNDFVKNGGTLILTCRSAVKDKDNGCYMQQLPAMFNETAGCKVSEYDPVGYDRIDVYDNIGDRYQCTSWCDVIECSTAKPILKYDASFYKSLPAGTVNEFGNGKCYYIGTVLFKSYYRELAKSILKECDIDIIDDLPERVEVTIRENARKYVYFIFNNSEKKCDFAFNGYDLSLAPFDMKIIFFDKS